MKPHVFKYFAIGMLLTLPLSAETIPRRAEITGGRGPAPNSGRCTIDVSVDHAAELEIRGDMGNLTTLGGQTAYWRGFRCNAPLPRTPHDFRLTRVNGRGSVRLIQDPRNNRGAARVHISDPQRGRANYALEVAWHGGDGWATPAPPPPSFPAPGPGSGGGAIRNAIRSCQEAVTDRLHRDGYDRITFARTAPDPNRGANDWITGSASATRRGDTRNFHFSCSVDFQSGRIRFVDVRRR
jgi:hypothetical protein